MKFDYDAKYFDPLQTLDCGQVFRFFPDGDGFKVIAGDKACKVGKKGFKTVVESDDCDFFYNYFDLGRDYSEIVARVKDFGIPLLSRAAEACSGLRLLNQNPEETIYSFIISQNNNIPRIKGVISRICGGLGKKFYFAGGEESAFPDTAAMAGAGKEFFKNAGAGYRDTYLAETSRYILENGLSEFGISDGALLKARLMKLRGVGPKVADCIALFGFGRRGNFPVDTWIEKIYREDFGGKETDRKKINAFFTQAFGEISGYVQQYLFYAKRLNL